MISIFLTNANITRFQPFYQHSNPFIFSQTYSTIPSLQSVMTEMKASSQGEYQEANAVRYVGGYVCYTIKHQLRSRPDSNFNQEILLALWELIEDLEVESESEPEEAVLPGSSKDWTSVINRGGLITMNDEAYEVFSATEAVIKTHYNIHNINNITDGVKSTLLKTVEEDDEVQFHWCIIASDMDADVSKHLLKKIIEMWITIRGFSFTKCYMELYKKK